MICNSIKLFIEVVNFQTEKKERAGGFLPESLFPPCSLKREADDESRSAATGRDANGALMFFDHLLSDEESEAGATLAFRGEKRLEDTLKICRRDTAAGIGYGDPHCIT